MPHAVTGEAGLLRVEHISKAFPGVQALDDVSLTVQRSEIHALVGENGAGKSTLMNIIAGVYPPDTGTIELDGAQVRIQNEHTASRLGVAMVHQEQSLAPRLSITENIFAGQPLTTRLGLLDWTRMHGRAREVLARLQVELDPRRAVATLSPAQRQMVEIAKALSRSVRLLILDEPTAALTLRESDHLFAVLRDVARSGVSILYVSHRLREVFELASHVTVLKDGRVTGVRRTSEIDVDGLIRLMVGRELSFAPDPRRAAAGAPIVLEVTGLHAPPVVDASLQVRAGEIVCLAGLVGAGRTELCEAIFGARPIVDGHVRLNDKPLAIHGPADAVRAGIGMVPEDRKEAGLFLDMSLEENIASSNLSLFSHFGLLSSRAMRSTAIEFVRSLRIVTPSIRRRVRSLSGGNQQKTLLARWLARRPRLLIVDEPTRGVDVGAKAEIYRILRDLAAGGTALLVVSSELPEVLALAHRIVVMAEGRLTGVIDARTAGEVEVLQLASPRREREVAA
ncbi:MAG: sugar ABC transporter ATP-binding protein [Chloroflexi bacterium]|nr:sugar ABC transporter ATP-binding protein [Chloroflexota bacterium]